MYRGGENGFVRQVFGWLMMIALAGGAAAWSLGVFENPGKLDQATLHERGTKSEYADFSGTVEQRAVMIPPPDGGLGGMLSSYAARLLKGTPQQSVQGEYDPSTESILIVGEEVRYQTRLPELMRDELYRVLRHEYGHSAFFDWMHGQGIQRADAMRIASLQRGSRGSDLPPALAGVFDEWVARGENVYGDPYFGSSLSEYLAESYARVLCGEQVPVRTKHFLLHEYGGKTIARVAAD